MNPLENVLDKGLDLVNEYAAPVIGGVVTGGFLYGAGQKVASAGKGTAKQLKKVSPFNRRGEKEADNSTNNNSTNQNSNTTSKSSGTQIDTPQEKFKQAKAEITSSRQSLSEYTEKLEQEQAKKNPKGIREECLDYKLFSYAEGY